MKTLTKPRSTKDPASSNAWRSLFWGVGIFCGGLQAGYLLSFNRAFLASPALLARFSEDVPMKGEDVVSERVKEFSVPVCSKEQVDLHKILFDYGNNAGKLRIPTSIVTRCPDDSSWVNEYYAKLPNTKPFVAINVGCNKGLDAIAVAGLFSQDKKFSVDQWHKSLGDGVGAPVCGAPNTEFFDGLEPRQGKVYCIEPVPSTFERLEQALEKNPQYKDTLVITQAAMSNTSGSVRFPNDSAGAEANGLNACDNPNKRGCVEVPLYTVDKYLEAQNVTVSSSGDDMIDLLMIDAEGFDWEVIQGSIETLKRTRYLIFEAHLVGNWPKHSLVNTIEQDLKEFTCYWTGIGMVWRITDCMDERLKEIFEVTSWSNVGCVRNTEVELLQKMEGIFLETLALYNQTGNPSRINNRGKPPLIHHRNIA